MAAKIIKHCARCGAEVSVKPSKAERTKYCSMACYNASRSVPVECRFWKFVDRLGDDDCWLWRGSIQGKYGSICIEGKSTGAHRVSYQLHKGEIPEGLVVMHSCDVPLCVNPKHLSAGTYIDNMQDMVRKGRAVRSAETKARISKGLKGRPVSQETRQKISASAKAGGAARTSAALKAWSQRVMYRGELFNSKASLARHLGGVHPRAVESLISQGVVTYAYRQREAG